MWFPTYFIQLLILSLSLVILSFQLCVMPLQSMRLVFPPPLVYSHRFSGCHFVNVCASLSIESCGKGLREICIVKVPQVPSESIHCHIFIVFFGSFSPVIHCNLFWWLWIIHFPPQISGNPSFILSVEHL